MAKLNQVNALVAGRKSETEKAVGDLYKLVQTGSLFDGRSRRYQPLTEEGELLPGEDQKVQQKVNDLLTRSAAKWIELFDLVATQDAGNQLAKADIVIESVPVLQDVPVTTLLFLEKQLNDVETFVSRMPTPDPSQTWQYDPTLDCLRTAETWTLRTKKVPRNHIKYEATKEHPAQVEVYMEDMPVGKWTQILYTGKMPVLDKNALLTRIKALKDAVKLAREQANSREVHTQKIGKTLFEYVFGTATK